LKQIQPDSKFQEDLKALLTRYPKVDSGFPINWEEVWEHSEK
jgi:hypothetical protein